MSAGPRRERRLLLTGGGTGGHLFPAIATAQEFQKRYPGTEVLFVGTTRKLDSKSLARYGFPSRSIRCYGIKGKNLLQLAKAVGILPLACIQALKIIREFRPDIVFGVGGYVTGPVVAVAKIMKIPIVIHEQNSVPGLANRKLGKLADRVCLSLPGSEAAFSPQKVVFTGNPVRQKILELANGHQLRQKEGICLLVMGGSQGARGINRLVPEALSGLDQSLQHRLKVIHQSGIKDVESVRETYLEAAIDAEVEAFFPEMHRIYERVDLVISRAGATTLSEISVLGIPALLIPYPHAADNHQQKNGQYYVDGGGALQFREKELTPLLLRETIVGLLENSQLRQQMALAMKKLSFPQAAGAIVCCCMESMEKNTRQSY